MSSELGKLLVDYTNPAIVKLYRTLSASQRLCGVLYRCVQLSTFA